MADPTVSDNTILKILSGTQTGAEVSLAKGDYVIGSGSDDDIQIIDVSLKPGHAKIRVAAGKIEIAGAAGSLKTANGVSLEANSGWQEIEPLDTVTAGTTRFAMGPPTAQWSTIAEAETQIGAPPPRAPHGPVSDRARVFAEWIPQGPQLIIPVAALVLLVLFAIWQLSSSRIHQLATGRTGGAGEVEAVRSSIAKFPFAKSIEVRQDVDSTIFVNGFVEAPVERRAVVAAIEKTGIPARVRVSVLQSVRSEIDSLIRSEGVGVTATVSSNGELILDGVILNEAAAAKFVELVKDRILGVARIESRIKTAKMLLGDIEKLSQVSGIGSWVLLRNDGDLIEANGAIPVEKIDPWVGFLQAYARRYAKDIGLRSFVQLQGINAPALSGNAIVIGGQSSPGDTELDVERLKQGMYGSSDVLVGESRPKAPGPGPAASDTSPSPVNTAAGSLPAPPPAASDRPAARTTDNASQSARDLLQQWRDGTLGDTPEAIALRRALDALAASENSTMAERYAALYAQQQPGAADSCWEGSHLTVSNVSSALFWLDLFSVSDKSLTSLDSELQVTVLEAALNPRRTGKCAAKAATDAKKGAKVRSLYLNEISRNPDFVRYIARDLRAFSMDITGANVGRDTRYVQLRSGRKYLEGAAPDRSSRLTVIGELGVGIQLKSALAAIVFGPDINWLSD